MFHKLRVSKTFMIKWVMSRSSVDFFLSPSTENLRRGNPSAFHKTSCVEEICGHVGMEQVSHFSFKLFCLTAPKNFIKKPSTVALVSGIENFYDKRGYVTISCRFFCLAVGKKFVEEPFCAAFQDTSVSEKVYG